MVGATRGLLFCLLAVSVTYVKGEMFTALADMERLVYQESDMVAALKQYIYMEEARLDELKRIADDFEALTKKATEDAESYLHHPVNAFLTVKRFLVDWNRVDELVEMSFASDYLSNISYHRPYFPTKEDFRGAALALFRLQETYKLTASDVADGIIQDTKDSPTMNALECFELGRVAYEDTDNLHTVMWMKEALKRAQTENPPSIEISVVLDYLSYSTYMIGDLKEALRLTEQLLDIEPDHQRGHGNKAFFEHELAVISGQKGDTGDMEEDETNKVQDSRPKRNVPEREAYEALCRGEQVQMTPAREKKLKCRLRHYNRPFLYLQPAKEEVVFDKPKLILYRDCISDAEIERLKVLAAPKLRRATIQNSVTGNLEFAEYRISKSAWLRDDDDDVVMKISKRIEYYTGLTMDTAEELQVANYGIGGHYEPHFDFSRRKKEEVNAFKALKTGNRIATMLFYMSEVTAGGATVFPRVGARLVPEKGTAAFWYNLLKSGEGDYSTRHAACPVLVGSKWVSNKWIHEVGQEFRRKCGMSEDR
ncbi:prolyl 4-hydroxylase subunit alpha-1-like isoform X2 [Ptychodera flava]|uniref:prolyl 4-hydroxylase subunit alpha-1-like isoform X2 n=1 Tax=Ptychodera flava TaxID=63121 RepID=UPI00396A0EAB